MRSPVRKRVDDCYDWFERKYRVLEYRRGAARRKKLLGGGYDCRKEYRQRVLPYWKPYGVKPGIVWYRLLSHASHEVDPRYIPDDLWFDRILPYYSNSSFRRFGEDKNYLAVWFPDARLPRTVVSRVAGVFYDENYRILPKAEAVRRCAAQGKFVIKPSVDSGEGRLIRFFDGTEPSAAGVEEEMLHASVFAMTSRSEGFPFVLLEAQSCGLPVVAFDVRVGPGFVVQDGVNGFLAADTVYEDFCEKLASLLKDEDLRREFSAAAISHAAEFSKEKVGEMWYSLIGE